MTNPLETIKKLKGKSLEELRTRGGQVFSAYSEQIGISGKLPTDRELQQIIDSSFFEEKTLTSQIIFDKYYELSGKSFFPAFADREKTIATLVEDFDEDTRRFFIEKANKILDGRFDLLGYLNLDFGESVDWHYEPISDKNSPLKHWKQFDELDANETGDKKIIWELNRHQYFFTLGVAYWLTGDERYAATFVRHINSWMEQNAPGMGVNWVSSLEVSFRLISWIWAFQFFRGSNSLTPAVFQKALKFLFVHGRHLEKYLSTYFSPNTHLTGEALGLYYLGTQFSFFKRAMYWRKLGSDILFAELDRQIHDDGVYFEQTTWYQRYTTDFYLQFIILQILSGDFESEELQERLSSKTQSLLDFLMNITRPDGTTPLIGDDDGGRNLPITSDRSIDFRGTLALGAVVFKRGDYKLISAGVSQEVLWLLGSEGVKSFENLRAYKPNNKSVAFKDGGYYIMRDGWSEDDNYLLIDGGEVGAMNGGHGHADSLSFEMAVGGRTILVDSGTYTYHRSKELRDFFRSSVAHNTLTINDLSSSESGGKFSWESKAEVEVKSWISENRFDFFEGSHNGYRHLEFSPAEVNRSVLFLKNDYWIMRDFVKTVGEHNYQQNFHFNSKTNPSIENIDNGRWCVNETPENEIGLRLFTFGDNGSWQRKESWVSNLYGERVNAPFLRYVSKGIGPQEFITFMLPAEKGFYLPEVFETEVVGGRAFVVNYRDYQDLFVFADGEQIIRTELFNTDFRFLWARVSSGERLPDEFVLIKGKNFSLGGRDIVTYPNELDFAMARRLGNKLNVRTSESVFSVSLPQKNSKTYILKTNADG
jgi:hypothetical protein